MIGVEVASWAAWAPGLESREAWLRWCGEAKEIDRDGCPDAKFLPAMLRRRCSPLARVMLTAAFECAAEIGVESVATVFASRHGNINESVDLLERLAHEQALSPTRFSHTVHNAQAGLFSIAASNKEASTSIAAQEDTFACGWVEAMSFLSREPARPVLFVMADIPLVDPFAPLVDEPETSYALALLMRSTEPENGLRFEIDAGEATPRRPRWPDALEFLRWHEGSEARLELSSGARRYRWLR